MTLPTCHACGEIPSFSVGLPVSVTLQEYPTGAGVTVNVDLAEATRNAEDLICDCEEAPELTDDQFTTLIHVFDLMLARVGNAVEMTWWGRP